MHVDHPYVATMLALSVWTIINWYVAYRCGYDRGLDRGRVKGFKHGFFEGGGTHDS